MYPQIVLQEITLFDFLTEKTKIAHLTEKMLITSIRAIILV